MAAPSHLPSSCQVVKTEQSSRQNFKAANGDVMENFGEAAVILTGDGLDDAGCAFQVTNVTRPLHATSRTCDTGKEVLFTAGECVVVPDGTFSKWLKNAKVLQRYPRKGNLYVNQVQARTMSKEMKEKASAAQKGRGKPSGVRAGFTRPGMRR